MSGQMSDVISIDGDEYAIVEPLADSLFDVRSYGVAPVMMHTANTRGVAARYRIDGGRLVLADLSVGSVDAPPPIEGVEATTDEYGQTWTYLQLDHPIAWTGDLLVGQSPILELFVHSGFLPVWHYEKVLAFDLEAGVVQSSEDRSEEVRAFREERTGGDSASNASAEAGDEDDENLFDGFLSSLKIRLGFDD